MAKKVSGLIAGTPRVRSEELCDTCTYQQSTIDFKSIFLANQACTFVVKYYF